MEKKIEEIIKESTKDIVATAKDCGFVSALTEVLKALNHIYATEGGDPTTIGKVRNAIDEIAERGYKEL